MAIKLIATDMDGTFLRSDGTYDKAKFRYLYEQMKQQHIHFVVASGNPLLQLQASFPDIKDELIFIAENGGYLVDKGKEIVSASIEENESIKITNTLKDLENVLCWVCTKHQSYTLSTISKHYFEMFLPYFPGVKKIDDFSDVQEPITKFALYVPDQNVEEVIEVFQSLLSENVRVVDSGHDCVDIIPANIHKGSAIQELMNRYTIQSDEIMAFGDAGNDLEMLQLATYGFAMRNAKEIIKDKVAYSAPSNDEDGVLQVIEQYLKYHIVKSL